MHYKSMANLHLSCYLHYTQNMEQKRENLQIRLTTNEKRGIEEAAELAGIPVSAWVRERLRQAAIRDLEGAGRRVPFVSDVPLGGTDA